MEDKDVELCLVRQLGLSKPLGLLLDVLLELLHSVLERRPGVVDLVNNQDVAAEEVSLGQRAEVQPLCAGDLGAGSLLGGVGREGLVEGKTDGLDGDVVRAGALEEGAEDAGGDVATTADALGC